MTGPAPCCRAGSFTIGPEHPALPGHFPGEPIVPGALLLDAATALMLAGRAGMRVARVAAAKFSAPVRPGEAVAVAWEDAGERVSFTCSVAGGVVARGTVVLAPSE